ncbi:trypsin-1-like [Cylas formicarius]|uniref:trypsin-1-like n=1 Tax=Cylas formicarius TaxID=197179 RepID=UPI002958BE7F|nr:trypsin-1-like [Cylas formicarius]
MIRLGLLCSVLLAVRLNPAECGNVKLLKSYSWRKDENSNPARWQVSHNRLKERDRKTSQIESPAQPRRKLRLNSSDLIFAHGPRINISGFKPGDVIMETVVTSQPLTLGDDNSTHKNVVDWFLGIVGLRPPDSTPEPSEPPSNCSKCSCGLALKHRRIVGGVETLINEYPWMVALLYNNRFFCGASLINNRYLLTAAHCVNGINKDRLTAVFLDHDRSNSFETTTFSRKIKTVYRHRSYGGGGAFNNDIALLKLDEEVAMTGVMRPVCLPPTGKSFTGHNGVAVGWGATSQHGQVSTKLREVTVPIMSNQDCRKTAYAARITDNMMCAGFPDGRKDSCQGDSGGPLHVVNGKTHEIVGIVSWGEGCAQPNYPGVYTRVNRYISWIKSNTKDACYC